MTTKQHSINYYLIAIALSGLLLLGLIGFNMVQEIRKLENVFLKSHTDNSINELQRAIDNTILDANDLARILAQWDETSQQISDPTYYIYWKTNRLREVHRIPAYVSAIELYRGNRKKLFRASDDKLPDTVPDTLTFVRTENDKPWLCIFRPIFLHDGSKEVFGYIGLKIDFFKAMLDSSLFSHNDVAGMAFISGAVSNQMVLPENIISHIKSDELHKSELDHLKNIIYVTFAYIVGLVLLILIILYWMVLVLFAKPLTQLNQFIRAFEGEKEHKLLPELNTQFVAYEISNLASSFQDYQLRLEKYQSNLKQLNNELEDRVKHRTHELESINRELEAFSYSVSHDLRAPLRTIDGFSQVIIEDYGQVLDETGKNYLSRIRSSAQHMAELIDDLLNLSRITRLEFRSSLVNLSELAQTILQQLQEQEPNRHIQTRIAADIYCDGDEQLLSMLLDNLLNNAWKYSSKVPEAIIEFGCTEMQGERVYFVKDNGVGFDIQYVNKIFEVFQRLHGREYEGTGIGLATVRRIIDRHHGRIWAESEPGKGATFYFTLATLNNT